ncbi:MAG: prepilin-type N-terminal cleavage/methylation domain-containing protein [Pirellulaceae bacterium]
MPVSKFRFPITYRRRGLTLLELIVVMTVLAATAAIVLPLLPNLLRRAHKVTDATQTAEMSKAIQTHHAAYLSYPDQWDLMTEAGGALPDFIPADDGAPFGGAQIDTLSEDEVKALKRVGITLGHHFVQTAPNHPTEDPYAASVLAPTTLTFDTTPVFVIDATTTGEYPVEISNDLQRDPTARFVVFGAGPRATMVGKIIQNAPTSVPQNVEFTPSTLYSRIGVIFQVAGTGILTTKRARFIGAVALEDDEIKSTEKDLVGYYDIAASGQ